MNRAHSLQRRVLLVEDDEAVRRSLRTVLESKGCIVEEADDGLDGVMKAAASKPDVVVIDIEMPIFDGYGVARRVREALGDGVRLIALTGHDQRERAYAAGFNSFLLKPAGHEEVALAVVEPG